MKKEKPQIKDPAIRDWQKTIEIVPEGTKEFILPDVEGRVHRKKIQYDPRARLFRFLSTDPEESLN
ncbi:MAG TPA: hypothetical protein VJJ72_01775, partial [Candidatus Paceibacterota bacterium]